MHESTNHQTVPDKGLRCLKCGHAKFRVVYTRPAHQGTIGRRRECRKCRARITTREHIIGA